MVIVPVTKGVNLSGPLAGSAVLAEPVREIGLIDASARQREDNGDDLFLRRVHTKDVQTQE